MIKVNPCALYRPRSFPLTRMTVTVGWGQHSWKSFFVVSMVLILSNFDPSNFIYQNLETQVISPTRIWQINTFHSQQSEFIGNSYRNMAEVLLIEEAPSVTHCKINCSISDTQKNLAARVLCTTCRYLHWSVLSLPGIVCCLHKLWAQPLETCDHVLSYVGLMLHPLRDT